MANYTFDLKPLAQGGEKDIHRGRCVETGVDVVVKFLRRPYSEREKQRFALEIERMLRAKPSAGAALTTILDSNLDHDPPFFIEEFVPDGTLAMKMAAVFAKKMVFSEGAALGYCRQVLLGLAGIHRTNQIHRDIKPSNILVRATSKTLVISDMGIGRTLDRSSHLQTRMFSGTRGYAAPEQELGAPVDHRADLYSVGVILHEMLTGQRGAFNHVVYKGENPAVRTILQVLLAFQPRDRYGSAQEAADAITATELATR
jgi:serine/threonine-protein kinase